jgi:hypothetical protein
VLWAEENSREALFEAMRRREAYATSGPRITLRFFGGSELSDDLCECADFAARGYQQGVPMGSSLRVPPGATLRFAVRAARDAGASDGEGMLERLQIIKGTLVDGEPRYQVIDVAEAARPGQLDLATCRADGGGASELCAVFEDREHSPGTPAFYYARVLEAPSCRWQARACLEAGVDCQHPEPLTPGLEPCCEEAPRYVRERAWSSPIFVDASE